MPRKFILPALVALFAATANAQTFEQVSFIRLHEAPMSVRSAAMGAATDAASPDVADLAANPAATTALKKRIISIGVARDEHDFFGPRFIGNVPATGRYTVRGNALAHVAMAIPLRAVSIGAYYRNEPSIEAPYAPTTDRAAGPYTPVCTGQCAYAIAVFPYFQRRERRYGVTAAWEAGTISLGAGAEVQELDEQTDIGRVAFGIQDFTAPTTERVFRRVSDRRLVPNAGIRWRATPSVAVALAYNGAASFPLTTSACVTDPWPLNVCTTLRGTIGASEVSMPDAYRASISVRPMQRLVVAGEVVQRNYSRLRTDTYTAFGVPFTQPYRDVTEVHAGAEYRFASMPFAIRGGWWRDPSHLEFQRDLDHMTFGGAWFTGNSRVDLAFDESDEVRRASIALVHSF